MGKLSNGPRYLSLHHCRSRPSFKSALSLELEHCNTILGTLINFLLAPPVVLVYGLISRFYLDRKQNKRFFFTVSQHM